MIKHLFLSLLLCVLCFYVSAQRLPTRLPQINLKKLASISNNKARIIKYYKMMRRDSIRRERAQKRLFKNLVDSTVRANRRAILGFSDSLPEKDGPSFSLDSVMYKATPIQALPKSDSTTIEAFAKMNSVREILGEKTRLPDTALAQVGVNSDSLSQKVHSLIDDDLETRIPSIKTSQSSIAESISLPADTIPDLREKAVSSLADHAVNYLEKHQDKILFAQQRLAKLIRRYSEFRNSNNLDGAVKRSSLADKRFSERVVFNVLTNITSLSPYSMDISALAGYRFTRSLSIGGGINVRFSGSDSIPCSHYISPRHLSAKAYTTYEIMNNFFLHAEWERVTAISRINESALKRTTNNVMVGVGRKFRVHPMLYMTLLGVYNLNPDDENPIHPKRFQIRSGFQLSELAMRKKNINYDPNR